MDFGAGTLHFALVAVSMEDAEGGEARVIAKTGRPLGGKHVDQWLLGDLSKKLGYDLESDNEGGPAAFWRQFMLAEARRVKEELFFKPTSVFQLVPPAHLRRLPEAGFQLDENPWLEITREHLVEVLETQKLYGILEDCLEAVLEQATDRSVTEDDIEEVLMVGGSTLLPEVYSLFEARFGRDRVRAWQPFQAVVYGASAFAAERVTQSDFIVHDYAIVTYNAKTHEKEYAVIVPRGTRFPTPPSFWRRQMVPTCALGEPESMFKLVICELGRGSEEGQRFLWDENGQLHRVGREEAGEDGAPIVVPLNESNPTLGRLDPPHAPSDRRPRIEISFSVNEERWLCATVVDLMTKRKTLKDAKIVRLV